MSDNTAAIQVLLKEVERYNWEYNNLAKDIEELEDSLEATRNRKIWLDEHVESLKETIENLRLEQLS